MSVFACCGGSKSGESTRVPVAVPGPILQARCLPEIKIECVSQNRATGDERTSSRAKKREVSSKTCGTFLAPSLFVLGVGDLSHLIRRGGGGVAACAKPSEARLALLSFALGFGDSARKWSSVTF